MSESSAVDPSLLRVRAGLADGDMRAVREAMLQLTNAGPRELEQRLGERAVNRMFQSIRRLQQGQEQAGRPFVAVR